jgi:hypothetical protein
MSDYKLHPVARIHRLNAGILDFEVVSVRDIQGDEYDLVQNEMDRGAIETYLWGEEGSRHSGYIITYRYYIIKIKDGDYLEIWGASTPALDDSATRLF